jgi:hypothetical protein
MIFPSWREDVVLLPLRRRSIRLRGRAKYFDTEKLTTFSLNFKLRLLNGHILLEAEYDDEPPTMMQYQCPSFAQGHEWAAHSTVPLQSVRWHPM